MMNAQFRLWGLRPKACHYNDRTPIRKLPWIRRATGVLRSLLKWTSIILVTAFAWIGFLYFTRGTAVRHVQGVGAGGTPVGVSEPEFPLSVTMLTGAWLAPGNRIEVMLNGDKTYPRL